MSNWSDFQREEKERESAVTGKHRVVITDASEGVTGQMSKNPGTPMIVIKVRPSGRRFSVTHRIVKNDYFNRNMTSFFDAFPEITFGDFNFLSWVGAEGAAFFDLDDRGYMKVKYFIDAVKALVKVDQDWIPSEPGTSLYVRPFVIATDEFLGVAPSKTYLFMIILSPSGAYYASGLNPVGIWIEDEFVRAVRGGIGFAKTGGNYAASLKAQEEAHEKGYEQILWLDGVERGLHYDWYSHVRVGISYAWSRYGHGHKKIYSPCDFNF